jgi:hypothetical protein
MGHLKHIFRLFDELGRDLCRIFRTKRHYIVLKQHGIIWAQGRLAALFLITDQSAYMHCVPNQSFLQGYLHKDLTRD